MNEHGWLVGWWRARKWRHCARMSAQELAVIRALLPHEDPRSRLLLLQASDAPEIRRDLTEVGAYRASITYVRNSEYLVELDVDVVSPWLALRDAVTGRKLKFRIVIARGGFLRFLEGVAEDGHPWNIGWTPEREFWVASSQQPGNWLPPLPSAEHRAESLRELAKWSGLNPSRLTWLGESILSVKPPASDADLNAAEARLGLQLPDQYREFVAVCNGFSIRGGRPYDVFGTADLFKTNIGGIADLQVGVTSLYEEGIIVLACSGEHAGKTFWVRPNISTHTILGDLRAHVADSLARIEGKEKTGD